MAELTLYQRAALEHVLRVLQRLEGGKAPKVEYLERMANEAIGQFHAAAVARGEATQGDYVSVRVTHDGAGHYSITPVVAPVLHSVKISI